MDMESVNRMLEDQCGICLKPFRFRDIVSVIGQLNPHVFYFDCYCFGWEFTKFLEDSDKGIDWRRSKVTCPSCREKIDYGQYVTYVHLEDGLKPLLMEQYPPPPPLPCHPPSLPAGDQPPPHGPPPSDGDGDGDHHADTFEDVPTHGGHLTTVDINQGSQTSVSSSRSIK